VVVLSQSRSAQGVVCALLAVFVLQKRKWCKCVAPFSEPLSLLILDVILDN